MFNLHEKLMAVMVIIPSTGIQYQFSIFSRSGYGLTV